MKIILVALTVFFSTCEHADMIKAKNFFDNAKCAECHNVEDFKDKTFRKSKTFTEMKGMVSACQIQHDAQWFDDDEHDVALYLNQEYFHFTEKE